MSLAAQEQNLSQELRDWGLPVDGDLKPFFVSLAVHLAALIALGLIPIALQRPPAMLLVSALPLEERPDLEVPQEFQFRELPSEEVGASSVQGEMQAMSLAPTISDAVIVPTRLDVVQSDVENAQIEINEFLELPTGLRYAENVAVKGAAGEGVTGAAGAIDRITHEILLSLEERKTLVVWLFDQTESLIPQREAIRDRFERIYAELGVIESSGNEAFVKHDDKPLLSAVMSFGSGVQLITKKPTDDLEVLKRAVMELPNDGTGVENVFGAVFEAARHFAEYRYTTSDRPNAERNVMLVVFTDEAGSDQNRAEDAIKMCRRWAMPVYVVGVPAPFGRKEVEFKWVDPDPRFDQRPRVGLVDQGPETFLPEQVRLGLSGVNEELALDSGFGPFALTRLCFETGGIYFAVHPNRRLNEQVSFREIAPYSSHLSHFFSPEVMRRYRPDYVSIGEYQKRVSQNKGRAALVQAAGASLLMPMSDPQREFIKRDEAALAAALSAAQQAAAAIEPKINALYETLRLGEADREKETVPRWEAGYDLAMGRVLAVKVRTETYNAMLAAAKRGLKFKNEKNNTWVLRPSDEISVGSQYAKLAERARMYLNRVVKEHPDTPWALLASRELKEPLSWAWDEKFTDLSRPPRPQPTPNNAPPAPNNNQKKMLPPPKQLRPLPKL